MTSQCYPLFEYSKQLGFVIQHAFNYYPAGPVRDIAAAILPSLQTPHLIRRWRAEVRADIIPALLQTLEGHKDSVGSVSVTSDGWRAVSLGGDNTLRVWDLKSGICLRIINIPDLGPMAVTTDGRRAVIGGNSPARMFVWDLDSGACLWTLSYRSLSPHRDRLSSVSVTPDGARAVSGGGGTVQFWDLENGTCLHTLVCHSSVKYVSLTPDGRCAISDDRGGGGLGS